MPQVIRMRAIHAARPTLFEDQVAGDLAEEVADEEQAGAEPEHGIGEPEA